MEPDSNVSRVVSLRRGETFSRAQIIHSSRVNPRSIAEARKKIRSYLTPVAARAKAMCDRNFHVLTTVSHIEETYQTVVIGLIIPKEGEEEIEI